MYSASVAIRKHLLELAERLPDLDTEVSDDDQLVIRDDSASVVVEMTTPSATGAPIPVFRDVTGEVYGHVCQIPSAADRIRVELKELGEHA